jgi:hypothetical protein
MERTLCIMQETNQRNPQGTKTSEKYEYVPRYFRRRVHRRETLACTCGEHILTALTPPRVFFDTGKKGGPRV